jgi:uncharacterized protein (UPF0548 family)
VARQLRDAGLTYGEAGQTAGVLPPGYHHLRRSAVIGSGAGEFAGAAHALFSWQAHLRAGLRVAASPATAEPGTVALLGLGVGVIRIAAPCRVIYAVHEPYRRRFAYGTLPGHPERGEEAFIIEQHHDGTVTFTITAFCARPRCWPGLRARPGEPSAPHHQPLPACAGWLTCAPLCTWPGVLHVGDGQPGRAGREEQSGPGPGHGLAGEAAVRRLQG